MGMESPEAENFESLWNRVIMNPYRKAIAEFRLEAGDPVYWGESCEAGRANLLQPESVS